MPLMQSSLFFHCAMKRAVRITSGYRPSDSLARSRKMIGVRRSPVGHLENVLLPLAPPPKSPLLLYLRRWRILLSSLETLLGPPPPRMKRPPLLHPHRRRIPLLSHLKVFKPPSLRIKPPSSSGNAEDPPQRLQIGKEWFTVPEAYPKGATS